MLRYILLFLLFVAGLVFATLVRVYKRVKPVPPTKKQLENQNLDKCQLFKYLPELRGKIAWLHLGDYPTPVHKMRVTLPQSDIQAEFYLKREDISSTVYSGNKVRTLEFQLACGEAMLIRQQKAGAKLVAFGGSGSNQCVALTAHATKSSNITTGMIAMAAEPANKDNALNYISMFSFRRGFPFCLWSDSKAKNILAFLKTVWLSNDLILMPGGANVTGTLGAVLELAEQMDNGVMPEPDNIFLALGSSCTTTGIILGIAMARKLNTGFKKPLSNFHLHAVVIHHGFARVPSMVRMAIRYLAKDTARLIRDLGGPDVTNDIDSVLDQLILDCRWAVEYGAFTPEGKEAKQVFEEGTMISMEDGKPTKQPKPWLCSCFTSKSAAGMLDFLRSEAKSGKKSVTMLWQTKSLYQAVGDVEPLSRMMKESNYSMVVKDWLKDSEISSEADYLPYVSRVV